MKEWKPIVVLIAEKAPAILIPVLLFWCANAIMKGQLEKISDKLGPLVAALFSLTLLLVALCIGVLLYLIQLLFAELRKKSDYTATLERQLLRRRKTTRESAETEPEPEEDDDVMISEEA